MTYGKIKYGLLMGLIIVTLVILSMFVPISTMFFALLIGLLFIFPILALVLILSIGASAISKT